MVRLGRPYVLELFPQIEVNQDIFIPKDAWVLCAILDYCERERCSRACSSAYVCVPDTVCSKVMGRLGRLGQLYGFKRCPQLGLVPTFSLTAFINV